MVFIGFVFSMQRKMFKKKCVHKLVQFNCFVIFALLQLTSKCVGKRQTMSRFVNLLSRWFIVSCALLFCQIGIFCLTSKKNCCYAPNVLHMKVYLIDLMMIRMHLHVLQPIDSGNFQWILQHSERCNIMII